MFGTPHVTNNEFSVWFMKSGGSMQFSEFSGDREVSHKLDVNLMHKLPSSLSCTQTWKPKPTSKCMYGISQVEFTKVNDIHVYLVDLLKWFNAKVLCMETQKNQAIQ